MEFFKIIRLRIGTAILKKKIAVTRRKVYYSNMSQVKNIGIVWDASENIEFSGLSNFYQKMCDRNIEVKIQGYFPDAILPNQYTAIRYMTCLRKEELNFFYHPVSAESGSFIDTRFDILIDINFRKVLPLLYISSLSNARFKVGLSESHSDSDNFDLMIDIKKPVDIDYYLSQVVYYLEMINSGAEINLN